MLNVNTCTKLSMPAEHFHFHKVAVRVCFKWQYKIIVGQYMLGRYNIKPHTTQKHL